jgi:hypothetical protein
MLRSNLQGMDMAILSQPTRIGTMVIRRINTVASEPWWQECAMAVNDAGGELPNDLRVADQD